MRKLKLTARSNARRDPLIESLRKLSAFAAQYTPKGLLPEEAAIVDEFAVNGAQVQRLVDEARAILDKAEEAGRCPQCSVPLPNDGSCCDNCGWVKS